MGLRLCSGPGGGGGGEGGEGEGGFPHAGLKFWEREGERGWGAGDCALYLLIHCHCNE